MVDPKIFEEHSLLSKAFGFRKSFIKIFIYQTSCDNPNLSTNTYEDFNTTIEKVKSNMFHKQNYKKLENILKNDLEKHLNNEIAVNRRHDNNNSE